MRPKPAGLERSYAAQFNDPSVVAAYASRPPYPDRLVSLVLDLAGRSGGSILDLGCGTGELARRLAPGVRSITAIDHAERMIDRARQLPGGNATNVKWIVGRVEDVPLSQAFSLALAAESFHWFDWDVLCPLLGRRVNSSLLVLIERCEVGSPWSSELRPLLARFSTNRDFRPYDLVHELVARSCYFVHGRRTFGPDVVRQSVDDYITSIHSRNGFSRDRMTPEAALQFDQAVRACVVAHAKDDFLEVQAETRAVWGQVRDPD